MAISDSDYKLLWGRAAGICSNPKCRDDLTVILEKSKSYHVGEMAHVIAKSPSGPRGVEGGGANSYDNLILLCPTCHEHVDKAPSEYPETLLRRWKSEHETGIRKRGSQEKFDDFKALKGAVSRLLAENKIIWEQMGPQSETAATDPGSNMYELWKLKNLRTIVPNNTKIINMIDSNKSLVGTYAYEVFLKFKAHADAFEQNQYERLDKYPLFPREFEQVFGK